MSARVHDWWELLEGKQQVGWHNHLAQSPARGCQCHRGTLAGAEGTKVCVHPSAQAHQSPWGGSMQLFAPMEHPHSAPGLARAHREAAAKAEYFLSTQNKLVHEDDAMAQAAHIVQCGQPQAMGADWVHCDSHWG